MARCFVCVVFVNVCVWLNVVVCFVCELLCDAVCFVCVVLRVFMCALSVFVCFVCDVLCDVVCVACLCCLCVCVFMA